MHNILVTGGLGFIGSNLIEFLLKNNSNMPLRQNMNTTILKNIDIKKQMKIFEFFFLFYFIKNTFRILIVN